MKLEFSRHIFFFQKHSNVKFHENLSSVSRVVSCGRAEDKTDVTKLTVAVRNVTNAPKTTGKIKRKDVNHRFKL